MDGWIFLELGGWVGTAARILMRGQRKRAGLLDLWGKEPAILLSDVFALPLEEGVETRKKKVVGSGVVVLLRKVATAATEVTNKYQGIELWMSLHGFHAPTILRNVKPSILDS